MLDGVQSQRPRLGAGAGPLIDLRVFFGPGVWRIGPAWAVLAGAFVSGAPLLVGATPLQLVGAAILADSAWGVLWRLTAAGSSEQSGQQFEAGNLPYYQGQSPAGRALATMRDMVSGASWHELMAGLALTVFLCVLLGMPAFVLSVCASAIILWAWVLTRAGKAPAACDALLNVGIPWLLGFLLAQPSIALGHLPSFAPGVTLGVAFTALQWGARRSYLSDGRQMGAAWLGQAIVLIALIVLQQSWALAVVVILLLPPAWWLWRVEATDTTSNQALLQGAPWWLAAMLIAAIALR